MNSETKYNEMNDFDKLPKEIQEKMLERQLEQGNKIDPNVFREDIYAGKEKKGFDWNETKEDHKFWWKVIDKENFDVFFEKYPKKKRPLKAECKCVKNNFEEANKILQAWAKKNNCSINIIVKSK
ncbi:MAG: hypothetical protein KGY51_11805 [Psychroflexus sp.]|nr:hypothetical protein [Psychroflexus sp.]